MHFIRGVFDMFARVLRMCVRIHQSSPHNSVAAAAAFPVHVRAGYLSMTMTFVSRLHRSRADI